MGRGHGPLAPPMATPLVKTLLSRVKFVRSFGGDLTDKRNSLVPSRSDDISASFRYLHRRIFYIRHRYYYSPTNVLFYFAKTNCVYIILIKTPLPVINTIYNE